MIFQVVVVLGAEGQVTQSSQELKRLLEQDMMSDMMFDDELSINSHYRDYVDLRDTFETLGVLDDPEVQAVLRSCKEIGMGSTFAEMEPASRLAAVNKEKSQYVRTSAKVPVSVAKSKELALFFAQEFGVVFVYGLVGSGKSALAHRLVQKFRKGDNAWMYACPREKQYLFPGSYRHFDDLEQLKSLPPGSVIIWDDATKDAWYLDFGTKFDKMLGKFVTLVRQHKLFLVVVIHRFDLFREKNFSSTPFAIYMKFTRGDLPKLTEERDQYVNILVPAYMKVLEFYQRTGETVSFQELGVFYDPGSEDSTLIWNGKCPWYGDKQSCFQATNQDLTSQQEDGV